MAGNAPLSVTLSLIDKATSGLNSFAERIESSFKPLNTLKNKFKVTADNLGLPKVKTALVGVKSGVGGVIKEVKSLGKEFALISGLAAGILGGIVYSTANAGDAAYKTAQKVGISTQSWTELAHAADMSGVQSEKLRAGLTKLNTQAVNVARGNKESAFWFRELGVNIRDQSGAIKSADVLFADVAEKISEMPDGLKKAGIASKLFGDGLGPDLIPLLNMGKAGLSDFALEAARAGIVITDEQGRAAKSFNDSFARVRVAIKGVTYSIGNQLIPVIEPLFKWLQNIVEKNRELIATKVSEWLAKLEKSLPDIEKAAEGFWQKLVWLGEAADSVVGVLGGWEAVLTTIGIALAAFKLMPLITSLGLLVKTVVGLGIALTTTPIGIVIVLAGGLYLLAKNSEFFRAAIIGVGAALAAYAITSKIMGITSAAGGLSSHIPGLVNSLFNMVPALGAKTAAMWASVKATLALGAAFMATPIGWITVGIGLLVAAFVYLWRNCESFRNFWISLWDKITGYITGAADRIKTAFDQGIIQGIYTVIKEFSPTTLFKAALDGVFSMIFGYSMREAAEKVGASILSGFKGYFPNIFSFFDGIFDRIKMAFDEGLIKGLVSILWEFSPIVFFTNALDKVVQYLTGFSLKDAGKDLMNSFWVGLEEVWSAITSWLDLGIGKKLDGMLDKIKGWFGFTPGPQPPNDPDPNDFGLGAAYGPPAGAADMIREQATINNNSIRDAHVTLDLKNVPQGADVETSGIEQVSKQQDYWAFVMNGGRMASF